MGPKIPSHHTDVAVALGAGDSFLLIRMKFEKSFTRPTPLKVCTCNCVKSLKIGGISPMMQPLKNCAFSLCETLNKIGKCLPDMETGRQSVCNFIRCTFYECHEVILVTWPLTQNSGHSQFRPWTDRRFQTTVGGVSSIPFAPIPSNNWKAGSWASLRITNGSFR